VKKLSVALVLIIVVALLLSSFNGCSRQSSAPKDTSKQLASVNNTSITENALNTRVSIFKLFYGSSIDTPQTRGTILDQLIEEVLLIQEAARQNVKVKPEDLTAEFTLFMDQLKLQFADAATMDKELKEAKLTEADFKTFLDRYLTIQGLYAKATEKVVVTDSDVSKYYEEHKAEFVEEESVRARHILVETKEEAQKLLAQVKAGKDFASLAKEFSKDPGSKDDGGELPRFGRGEMYEEFETAAFALSPGQLSGVVNTPAGFHIIRLEEKFPEKQLSLDEVKDQIKEMLLEERRGEAFDKIIADLQSKAKINKTP
jgi:foldase protein PrsA